MVAKSKNHKSTSTKNIITAKFKQIGLGIIGKIMVIKTNECFKVSPQFQFTHGTNREINLFLVILRSQLKWSKSTVIEIEFRKKYIRCSSWHIQHVTFNTKKQVVRLI